MKYIFTPQTIIPQVQLLKTLNKKIIVIGGCFDILHRGHVIFLKKSKSLGDVLIVFLESDERVKRMKGESRPVNSQKDRAEVLVALKPVDYVIALPTEFHNNDYDALIQKIQPDMIATTTGDPKIGHKQRAATLVGAKLKQVCSLVGDYSTSNLMQKIREY